MTILSVADARKQRPTHILNTFRTRPKLFTSRPIRPVTSQTRPRNVLTLVMRQCASVLVYATRMPTNRFARVHRRFGKTGNVLSAKKSKKTQSIEILSIFATPLHSPTHVWLVHLYSLLHSPTPVQCVRLYN